MLGTLDGSRSKPTHCLAEVQVQGSRLISDPLLICGPQAPFFYLRKDCCDWQVGGGHRVLPMTRDVGKWHLQEQVAGLEAAE